MTSLLDVSVLISLLDATHEHHAVIKAWWDQNDEPWASCPITQNGYLQIVTWKDYSNTLSVKEAIKRLSHLVSEPSHEFLPDNISLLDPHHVAHQHIQGRKQLTDVYLLSLAVFHGVQFVTLDQRVSLIAVKQATEAYLHVIKP